MSLWDLIDKHPYMTITIVFIFCATLEEFAPRLRRK